MGITESKVAIITGGSRGIGAGLVNGYRSHGWAVVSNARSMIPSDDPEILAIDGDIAEPATTERIIDQTLERFGRIDTLINNAGVFIAKPFTDYTPDDYAAVIGVNLTGFFSLTQAVVGQMLRRRGGHIVNITTTLVDHASSTVPSVLTSLTKGGLAAATRSLAIEYASRRIRVNAVSLGVIDTHPGGPPAGEALIGLHPLGRLGQIGDVVDGILFLEFAPFITGEILHIDGGQTAGH